MEKMFNNYVSVSGVSTLEELDEIGRFSTKEKFNFPVAIGYQVSNKSINQGTANPRQPYIGDLRKLNEVTLDYNLIPAFHYYTKDNSTIIGDLEKLVSLSGAVPKQSLLQLNTLPPDIKTLEKIKQLGFKTIFKVAIADKSQGGYAIWKGREIQDFHFGDLASLLGQVRERKDSVDYVMFDPSHGTNLPLNLYEDGLAVRFGKEISKKFPNIGLVYAGGVGPDNVSSVVKYLSKSFSQGFSIDTESRVRTNNTLDISLVKKYLLNSREALEGKP